MAASGMNIYQFKVTLKGIRPPIWRRIQVSRDISFYELHNAIQNSMGWGGSHLHQFEVKDPRTGMKISIGKPYDSGTFGFRNLPEIIPEERAKIAQYFVAVKDKAQYEYDFGDGWTHDIVLEKILRTEEGVAYPRCVKGKRACPPEDCGGTEGYEDLLEIIANPDHPEYKEKMEWMQMIGNETFDPEEFNPAECDMNFDFSALMRDILGPTARDA